MSVFTRHLRSKPGSPTALSRASSALLLVHTGAAFAQNGQETRTAHQQGNKDISHLPEQPPVPQQPALPRPPRRPAAPPARSAATPPAAPQRALAPALPLAQLSTPAQDSAGAGLPVRALARVLCATRWRRCAARLPRALTPSSGMQFVRPPGGPPLCQSAACQLHGDSTELGG